MEATRHFRGIAFNSFIRTIICLLMVLCAKTSLAYSILVHEAMIDSCWAASIQPLLLAKYPRSTKEQLRKAHAFAYGGAIAPDIGYFPFGKPLFTNLVHYVRSGDFVNALLADAQNIDEYAFAIGFLCHYVADKYGHSLATNKSVPILYPNERQKYGDIVTYEEDHLSHRRTEFGFDVLQIEEGGYSKINYHDFIGFEISNSVLGRAFAEVYGLDIHEVFANFSLATATLRWSFKKFFPTLTKAAWVLKKNELKKAHSGQTRGIYVRPGVIPIVLAFFVEIVPKIGPLRVVKFKPPGPVVEKLYHSSFDTALINYKAALQACQAGTSRLANIDFDTGNFTTPGEYGMADKNYDLLLADLQKNNFRLLNDDLRVNIMEYYSHRVAPMGSRKVQNAWAKTEAALQQIRGAKEGENE
jgi:hypothetical protein